MRYLIIICFFWILFPNSNERFITIGGCVTEIVFDLDLGSKVVAVDQSSTIPEKVKDLPQVGYIRAISAEGILSMFPTKILTTTDIGPPNVVQQLQSSGIDVHIFNSPHSFDDILALIDEISSILDVKEKGDTLKQKLINFNKKSNQIKSNYSDTPKIAFFMNPSLGSYSAAGDKTRADYLIKAIGGSNIFKNQFNRYKKVSKEAIVEGNPDIILIGTTISQDTLDIESIFHKSSEFKSLNAVSSNQVFYIDMGEYLNFGSSFAKNVYTLIDNIDVKKK